MSKNMIPSHGTLVSRAALAVALGLGAALSAGCAQEPLCPELGDCGGTMPTGNWALSSGPAPTYTPDHPSCSEDLYVAPTDTRLLGGEITPARQPTIEPALWDWCSLLLTGAGAGPDVQLKPPGFFYESGQVGAATISYMPDDPVHPDRGGAFTTGIKKTGRFILDFPALCVRAFGATNQVDLTIDPSGAPVHVCERLQKTVGMSGVGEGSYPNTDCYENLDASDPRLTPTEAERQRRNVENGYPADPYGCLCEFDVTEAGGPSGRYVQQDNTIVHMPSGNYMSRATFCHEGNRLQLTGADGSYLFNISGLRTMDLGAAP